MSSFKNYNTSPYNLVGLTDEEIQKIYFKCERGYNNEYPARYYRHHPITNEEATNVNFLRDSVVKMVYKTLLNSDFIKKMANDNEMDSILKKMNKDLKRNENENPLKIYKYLKRNENPLKIKIFIFNKL